MIITICGSIKFAKEMIETGKVLEEKGFEVLLTDMANSFAEGEFSLTDFKDDRVDGTFQRKHDLIRKHFKKIEKSDAILVLNHDRKGVKNYVGGATFGEIAVAFYLDKSIYLLNPIPQGMPYTSEIEAMDPIILNGDLNNIKI